MCTTHMHDHRPPSASLQPHPLGGTVRHMGEPWGKNETCRTVRLPVRFQEHILETATIHIIVLF